MPVVGTAGHVDHGKSTLVERLTGRDPDRWDEEKRRGLTIDLGFAWTTLPGGREVSFVDVPGHERLLKNMLAGVEAIDIALLVVAADEGWMPQTEEHLAVLDLLGIAGGVVALTKIDLVDTDLLQLAEDEISRKLAGTSLAGAVITPVSSVSGSGIAELTAELDRLLPDEDLTGDRPRLWVDRSFSTPGAGTIVTGTLLGGRLETSDEIEIYPTGMTTRIRGLQSHERSATALGPRRRVAVNLSGLERSAVGRGHMLGEPGRWESSSRFSAVVRLARYVDEMPRKASLHLHMGSGAWPARLAGLDQDTVVVETRSPIPMATGDRFILRDTGRRLVIAGGRVLDPSPGRLGSALSNSRDIDPDAGVDRIATALLAIRGQESTRVIDNHSGGGTPDRGELVGTDWVTLARLDELSSMALELVEDEHERHPLREGLSVATLSERLGVGRSLAEAVVEAQSELTREGAVVSRQGRLVAMGVDDLAKWEEARKRIEPGLAVPRLDELDLDEELLHLLIRRGELVRVSEHLALLPSQVAIVKQLIASMPTEFTVADFRDVAGLSRKYAVPLLEWADKEGLTIRRGDARSAR